MIITCPDCATRYDVDDERFTPDGRSVRCSACGESWFVPAPEELDVEPVEDLSPASRVDEVDDEDKPKRGRARLKVRIDEEDEDAAPKKPIRAGAKTKTAAQSRAKAKSAVSSKSTAAKSAGAKSSASKAKVISAAAAKAAKAASEAYDDIDLDDDEDDCLFDAPLKAEKSDKSAPRRQSRRDAIEDDEPTPKGWRKGRKFIVEDDDEDDDGRFGFFSRGRKNKNSKDDDRNALRGRRDALRFCDERDDDDDIDYDDERDDGVDSAEAVIVDADWEDVGEYGERGRGFGQRMRQERRRATALARMEDVRRFDPDYFDEEFFASLRVTPRELERALRKARRRAEWRDKNRMTPLRAFGWSAWVAAVAGTIYAVVAYRDEIVKIAPQTADAYAVVGIEANRTGLSIADVNHRLAMSTGGAMIEITGALNNAGDDAVDAPLLQAEALGPRGELLSRWTFTPDETKVAPGGSVSFVTRAPAPEGVAEVALSFAPAKSAINAVSPLATG